MAQYIISERAKKDLVGDGKKYSTDVGNTEKILRIIQSIPSPKAEPFKMWLAQVGSAKGMIPSRFAQNH